MPLDAGMLKDSIVDKIKETADPAITDEDKLEVFAKALADAIVPEIQKATITVPGTGLIAPSGAVTGSATGSLS